MKRIITTTAAATAALAVALCTPADAGGRGKVWKRILLGAIIAGVAGPAFAGDSGYRYYDDAPPYGYGYGPINGNGPYSYGPINGRGYVNGRNGGYEPKPPVPVTPSHCQRPIFDTQARAWRCPPVLVPQWNGY